MRVKRKEDYILIFAVIGLVLFGVVMVFSASYYTALNSEGDAFYYLKRDILWAGVGGVLMLVTSRLPYKIFAPWAVIIMAISVILLVLVLTPVGTTINYAQRWISVAGITIMPGELAKPAVIIFSSWYLSRDPERTGSLVRGTLPMWGLMAVCGGLIVLQPNFSTAVTVCAIIALVMIASGTKLWHLGLTAGMAIAAGVVLVILEPYRLERIKTLIDPFADAQDSGFQAAQSLIAIGSGGLTGVGLGGSIQKMLYLPEPMNDFIFSIIGEELGFIGCILLMALYAVFIWRGTKIAIECKDNFGTLLAAGITFMVAFQVVINIGVVTCTIPNTGVSLPFISWGGNSLSIMMACAGILVNISKNNLQVTGAKDKERDGGETAGGEKSDRVSPAAENTGSLSGNAERMAKPAPPETYY